MGTSRGRPWSQLDPAGGKALTLRIAMLRMRATRSEGERAFFHLLGQGGVGLLPIVRMRATPSDSSRY